MLPEALLCGLLRHPVEGPDLSPGRTPGACLGDRLNLEDLESFTRPPHGVEPGQGIGHAGERGQRLGEASRGTSLGHVRECSAGSVFAVAPSQGMIDDIVKVLLTAIGYSRARGWGR